ncbi:MAG: hypothetical protein JO247_06775 [Chloroflexi bacterium]|nr:hypothetical protein [Chloroflexota bacterium]
MSKMIAAVFYDDDQLQDAYRRLQDAGLPGDHIGIVRKEVSPGEPRRHEGWVRDADEWAGGSTGAILGGAGGALAGAAAAGAVVAVPIIGPVLAAGALAGIVGAAGGGAGWLAGVLAARGIDEQEAKFHQTAVEQGDTVLTVQTDDGDVDRVRSILNVAGGTSYREQ